MDKFNTKQAFEVATVLKQLAHPDRLRVLCTLVDKEKTVNELVKTCQASQSWVSQFLARMKHEGLVESRREGLYVYYKVADPGISTVMRAIQKAYCNKKVTSK
ncbi:MAG: winged helix-turn-helix transcriptional regulator [Oligoflexia bacterium]|nr:winged helix-turn-helix transcriptional regulator [Oligoflexia bacterium]